MFTTIKIIFLFSFLNGFIHPVHVSITNMEYEKEKSKITISFKVFNDDFRLLFIHLNETDIDLQKPENYENYKDLIDEYFKSHFTVTSHEKNKLELVSTNWKLNAESIWFYYEIPLDSEIRSLKITNSILFDLFYDQKNLLIFKANNHEKGYQFEYKKNEVNIDID